MDKIESADRSWPSKDDTEKGTEVPGASRGWGPRVRIGREVWDELGIETLPTA